MRRSGRSAFGVHNRKSSTKMHDRFHHECPRTRIAFERLRKGANMTPDSGEDNAGYHNYATACRLRARCDLRQGRTRT
jgi:hypothetical protein